MTQGRIKYCEFGILMIIRIRERSVDRTELESTVASLPHLRVNGRDRVSLDRPLHRQIIILLPLDEWPNFDGHFHAVRHCE